MNRIILIALVLLTAVTASAQYAGYNAVADLEKFKTDFAAATRKTSSIRSDFTQEKT